MLPLFTRPQPIPWLCCHHPITNVLSGLAQQPPNQNLHLHLCPLQPTFHIAATVILSKRQVSLFLKALQWLPIPLNTCSSVITKVCSALCDLYPGSLFSWSSQFSLSLTSIQPHGLPAVSLTHQECLPLRAFAQGCNACPPESHVTHSLPFIIFLPPGNPQNPKPQNPSVVCDGEIWKQPPVHS